MPNQTHERPSHGFTIEQSIHHSPYPALLTFALTQDDVYVPVVIRKPHGIGPFPAITMGRGDGRGGMPHILEEVQQLTAMQDQLIERGYVVAYVNYRNEIPKLYGSQSPVVHLVDDVSGGENRILKSAATLDSDDLTAIVLYLQTLPYVKADAIGSLGISHGGEMILKAMSAGAPIAAGVIAEGASHEFLSVDTGPNAPRIDDELQYNDINIVKPNAIKPKAMSRIQNIHQPVLNLGRDQDHLQGIFQLVHEWMLESAKNSTWQSFDHPVHGYALIYNDSHKTFSPDPIQKKTFDLYMNFFDQHLK
jgi:dienelactone hydrolase